MTEKTIDSTQPGSGAQAEGLTEIPNAGAAQLTELEELDRDDRPVADLARELPPEQAAAVGEEGDWAGDAGNHLGDDGQRLTELERK